MSIFEKKIILIKMPQKRLKNVKNALKSNTF